MLAVSDAAAFERGPLRPASRRQPKLTQVGDSLWRLDLVERAHPQGQVPCPLSSQDLEQLAHRLGVAFAIGELVLPELASTLGRDRA